MPGPSASESQFVRDQGVENVPERENAPLILVADDVSANVELLFDQLHVLGFRAIAAGDPKAARKAMRHLVKSAFEDTTASAPNGAAVNLSAP